MVDNGSATARDGAGEEIYTSSRDISAGRVRARDNDCSTLEGNGAVEDVETIPAGPLMMGGTIPSSPARSGETDGMLELEIPPPVERGKKQQDQAHRGGLLVPRVGQPRH